MKNIDLYFDFEYYGAAVIDFEIDNQHHKFESTYMGENPLNALITALWQLTVKSNTIWINENGEEETHDKESYNLIWQNEPWGHTVKLVKDKDILHITIIYFSDTERYNDQTYSFVDTETVLEVDTNFYDFTSKVCKEAIRALRKYGFLGYARSWDTSYKNEDFPIAKLLYLLGSDCQEKDDDLVLSDFNKELKMLTS